MPIDPMAWLFSARARPDSRAFHLFPTSGPSGRVQAPRREAARPLRVVAQSLGRINDDGDADRPFQRDPSARYK